MYGVASPVDGAETADADLLDDLVLSDLFQHPASV
jgi:hypothetical protein